VHTHTRIKTNIIIYAKELSGESVYNICCSRRNIDPTGEVFEPLIPRTKSMNLKDKPKIISMPLFGLELFLKYQKVCLALLSKKGV